MVLTAPASTFPSQNGFSSGKLPPQVPIRAPLTQNFENVRNALGAGGGGGGGGNGVVATQRPKRKRCGSPDLGIKMARPKLRRSMSFNDLNSIANLTTMKQTKKFALPTVMARPRRPNLTVPKPLSRDIPTMKPKAMAVAGKPPAKPMTTATTKASATLAATKVAAKPRIPPYDFKARFNDLTERHKTLREKYDALSENLIEYESLPEQYDECQQKLFQTENELRNVKVELECLQRQTNADKIKIDSLTEQLKTKTEECRVSVELNQSLLKENQSLTAEVTELRVTNTELSEKNQKQEEQLQKDKETMYHSNLERKNLHNTIMDLRGNIRVFCRVRPPLDTEVNRAICAWQYYDDISLEIGKLIIAIKSHHFSF